MRSVGKRERKCSPAAAGAALLLALAIGAAGARGEGAPGQGRGLHPALESRLAATGGAIKAWVFFTGKGVGSETERAAAFERLHAGYDPRAVRRRELRRTAPGLFDERDLPVAEHHLDALRAAGAEPVVVSRWLNAASARLTLDQARRIAALPFVYRIEPVRRSRRVEPRTDGGGHVPVGAGSGPYGLSNDQLAQINLIALHEQGYTGAGVVVGVLDTGFQRSHEAFNHPDHPIDVIAEWDFLDVDKNTAFEPGDPPSQHNHGTWILGVLAAYMPGELIGGAWEASYVLAKTEDTTDEYPAEEDYYAAGLEFIEANGGDVATSSLGYTEWYTWFDMDGVTAVTSIAVNVATANGVVCCTAVGNGGRDSDLPTLIAPSDAFDVLSCGAVTSTGEITDFSSAGPTADGRLKPEVLARGQDAASVSAGSDDQYVTSLDGTSLSTPLVACAVACVLQAHPAWTVAQVRANLFETASDFVANGVPDPDFIRGYGIIDAYAAAQDCNGNGTADLIDIAEGAPDRDGDGVPDECQETCPADADGDGSVGITDLLGLLAAWGSSDPDHDIAPEGGDGVVNIADLLALLAAWGLCR